MLHGVITLHGGTLAVLTTTPPPEPLARCLQRRLVADPGEHSARDWLSYLAGSGVIEAVGDRLARAGHVRAERRRRLLRRAAVAYVPADIRTALGAGARVHGNLTAGIRLTVPDVLLGGLIVATGLDRHVLWDLRPGDRDHLCQRIAHLAGPLRELVAEAEAAVGEAVLSHRT